MNQWERIYDHLNSSSLEVYPPGVKQGACTSPYVVVKDDGSAQYRDYSSNINYYSVLCYVPKNEYSKMNNFVASVERAMKELEPTIMPTHQKTTSFYDDGYKAFMVSVMYRNYSKQ